MNGDETRSLGERCGVPVPGEVRLNSLGKPIRSNREWRERAELAQLRLDEVVLALEIEHEAWVMNTEAHDMGFSHQPCVCEVCKLIARAKEVKP